MYFLWALLNVPMAAVGNHCESGTSVETGIDPEFPSSSF